MDEPTNEPTVTDPTGPRTVTHIAAVVFNRVEVPDSDDWAPGPNRTYVECRLVDPPVDFAVGTGLSLSDAFEDMRRRVFDSAVYSARLLHDDPEEWERRAGGVGGADV